MGQDHGPGATLPPTPAEQAELTIREPSEIVARVGAVVRVWSRFAGSERPRFRLELDPRPSFLGRGLPGCRRAHLFGKWTHPLTVKTDRPGASTTEALAGKLDSPPHRPDGPYQTFQFTFVAGKVTKIDEGGVGCVYREYRE
jgi:hypothetical protein